jgi:hypothetical protein
VAVQERTEREQVVISVHVSCKERRGPVTEYTECQAFYPLSSRPNWVPPSPHPQESVALPFGSSLVGEGVGEPISDDGTDTLVFYRCIAPAQLFLSKEAAPATTR